MRFATKGAKFNLDNIKTFEEIYTNIENSCIVLKDIDKLIQEQGIGELLASFKSLDLDYIGSKPIDKASRDRFKELSVLPLIQAIATDPLSI